jgi:hypothetical protein
MCTTTSNLDDAAPVQDEPVMIERTDYTSTSEDEDEKEEEDEEYAAKRRTRVMLFAFILTAAFWASCHGYHRRFTTHTTQHWKGYVGSFCVGMDPDRTTVEDDEEEECVELEVEVEGMGKLVKELFHSDHVKVNAALDVLFVDLGKDTEQCETFVFWGGYAAASAALSKKGHGENSAT